jgi:phosphate transport system substrate-binding protein
MEELPIMITAVKSRGALLLLLALIVPILAACGGAGTTSAPTSAPAAAAPTAAEAPTAAPAPTAAAAEPTAMAEPTAAAAAPTAMAEPTAATAGGTTTEGKVSLPEVDPASAQGNIITAGSSTVFPLTQRMAEKFKDEGYTGNITVDSIGTGAGFERFCKTGETDISNASRAIKKEEAENCAKLNPPRTPVEFRVGTDALAVVVSKENTFADNLTKAQLADIFSGKAATWDAVNPAWPKEKIQLFSPGTDSGTFDYFVEQIMTPVFVKDPVADKDKGKQAILGAPGIQLSENDNVLAQGVEGSQYAIGYFGFAYFKESGGKLKTVQVEGVEPDFDTAESGKYPLARPLFIYSDAKILKDKPQVAAFINFYLTQVNAEIDDVGYFPASADALDKAKQNWLDATK